jgi:hypothetical protein
MSSRIRKLEDQVARSKNQSIHYRSIEPRASDVLKEYLDSQISSQEEARKALSPNSNDELLRQLMARNPKKSE